MITRLFFEDGTFLDGDVEVALQSRTQHTTVFTVTVVEADNVMPTAVMRLFGVENPVPPKVIEDDYDPEDDYYHGT